MSRITAGSNVTRIFFLLWSSAIAIALALHPETVGFLNIQLWYYTLIHTNKLHIKSRHHRVLFSGSQGRDPTEGDGIFQNRNQSTLVLVLYHSTYGEATQNVSSISQHYYGFLNFGGFLPNIRLLGTPKFRIKKSLFVA